MSRIDDIEREAKERRGVYPDMWVHWSEFPHVQWREAEAAVDELVAMVTALGRACEVYHDEAIELCEARDKARADVKKLREVLTRAEDELPSFDGDSPYLVHDDMRKVLAETDREEYR